MSYVAPCAPTSNLIVSRSQFGTPANADASNANYNSNGRTREGVRALHQGEVGIDMDD